MRVCIAWRFGMAFAVWFTDHGTGIDRGVGWGLRTRNQVLAARHVDRDVLIPVGVG